MKILNKLLAAIQLYRPVNFLITFFSIAVAGIICIHGYIPADKILLAMISGSLTASAGNVINDIFDIDIDKINKPDRPLPAGKFSKNAAVVLYLISLTVAVILSGLINEFCFIITVAASILLFFYSYKLKKIILFGNITIASLTGLAFIYGGMAVHNVKDSFIPAIFAFLINLIRELVKDMEDIKGDLQKNIITFPHRFGFAKTKIIITFISIILILFTFYPFIFEIYAIAYFIVIMALVNPIVIYFLNSIKHDDSGKNLNKLSFLLKLDMIFGLTAIFLGK